MRSSGGGLWYRRDGLTIFIRCSGGGGGHRGGGDLWCAWMYAYLYT